MCLVGRCRSHGGEGSQSALSVTSTSGTYGTAVTLATSGGTTGGSVSYVVADGSASGCLESSGSLTSTSAGTCTVTATMAGNTNYDAVSSSATTVTFGAKALTVTGVTASNKVYDGSTSATLNFGSASLVGVVSGDSSSEVDIDSSSASGTFASSAVATGVAVSVSGVALSGSKASSYSVSQPTGVTADITSASRSLSFSVTSYSKTYGDASFSVSASPSVGSGTVTYSGSGSACSVNVSTGAVTITGAGSCSISASVASDGTYDGASTTVPATVTVGQAPLTVTASSHSVTYGDAVPVVSASYSGFVNSESSADLSTVPSCSTVYTTTSSAADAPATSCSGAASDDYSFTYVDGSVTIAKKTLTVTASSHSVTYGDAVPVVSASYSGFVNSESSADLSTVPSCSTVYSTTSSVGTSPVTSCSGGGSANYSFTYVSGSVSIGQATPVLSWGDVSKTFGDSAYSISAPTASVAGSFSYVSSDASVVSVSGSTVTVAGAGSATITATFTPSDATNYVSGGTVSQSVTVAKGAQSALSVTSTSGTYGTAVSLATSGGSTSGTVTYVVADGSASGCAESSGSLTSTSAGTCSVTATMAGDDDYLSVSSPATTVTFAKASQSITFAHPASGGATYGDAPIPVAPTSDSGLTVTLTSSDTSVCSVSGGGVNLVGAGTCTITASQAGDDDYLAATDVVRTFTVAKAAQASLSVTSASSLVFGESVTLASAGGSGTGVVSYSVADGTASGCGVTAGELVYSSAGTCSVTALKASDSNYLSVSSSVQTVTISKAGQTVAFTSSVPGSPVSGDTYSPAASAVSNVTGLSSGVSASFAVSGPCGISSGVVTFTASGSCVVTASAASNTNFNAASDVTQTIVVGSINQNITFAQPSSASFGSASVSMGATASSGLTVTYTLGAGTTNSACSVSSLGVATILAVGVCEVVAAQAGDSQYAAASSVTRAFQVVAALPTAPTLTSASASSQAVTVAFTAPGFTGGVSISGYEVVATPVGSGTTVTDRSCAGSPCTIGGLVNGESYTVTVAAINTAGTGPVSSATGSLTPATAAYAVGALSAVPGDTVVDLSWTALSTPQLGGGSFTRYEVSYRAAGVSPTPAWTLATSSLTTQSTSSYRVTGLDNGTSYDFQVVAITSANTAEIAGNTAQVVQYPSTVPGVPRTLTVLAATPTDVQFSWATPLTDGGSTITGYTTTVTSTTSGATTPITCSVSGTTTRCDASSLTNGAVYTLTVEATNRMSTGSNGNVASTTYNVPSADATLSALVVTGSAGVVTLTPTFDASTTDYTASVNYDVSSVTVTPTTTAAAATVTVEGTAVVSGVASGSVALGVGANSIEVEVTASDTRFSETYTVAVTRGAAPVSNSGGGGTDATTPAVIGVDLEPFQPSLEAPETNNGEALYIDANDQSPPLTSARLTVLDAGIGGNRRVSNHVITTNTVEPHNAADKSPTKNNTPDSRVPTSRPAAFAE
jgi:hypothetical protein